MRVPLKKIRPQSFCRRAALLAGYCLLLSPILHAQPNPQTHGAPRFEYQPEIFSFTQGVSFLSWELKFDGQTQQIHQAYLPTALSFPVFAHTNFTLGTAGSFAREGAAPAREFNGLSDVRMRLSRSFGAAKWFVGAGVNLPTGKNKLNAEENAVVNVLNENVLGFPLQRYGAGLDLELSLARTFNLSDQLGMGWGATLVVPGQFEFREESATTYQPGARYVATMILNRINPVLAWRMSLLGQYFAYDRLAGEKFFQQGWQFEPGASLDWEFTREWRMQLAFTHIWKDDNKFVATNAALLPAEHYYLDNSTYAKLALQRSFKSRTQAGAYLHANHFGKSSVQQLSRASVVRAGAQMLVKLSEHAMIGASADYAAGSAQNTQGGDIDLRGYGLGLWLKTQL